MLKCLSNDAKLADFYHSVKSEGSQWQQTTQAMDINSQNPWLLSHLYYGLTKSL